MSSSQSVSTDQTGSSHIIVAGLGSRGGGLGLLCRPPHCPLEFHLGWNLYMIFDFEESWAQKMHPIQSHASHMCSSGQGDKKTCEQPWLQPLNHSDFFPSVKSSYNTDFSPQSSCHEADCVVGLRFYQMSLFTLFLWMVSIDKGLSLHLQPHALLSEGWALQRRLYEWRTWKWKTSGRMKTSRGKVFQFSWAKKPFVHVCL